MFPGQLSLAGIRGWATILFPITRCKYGANFNFTCIKIRQFLGCPADGAEGARPCFCYKNAGIAGVSEGGWNVPLGLVGKRFHPRGWMQRGKRTSYPTPPSLSRYLSFTSRGKPGEENQSLKLEYKPISGGVRGLRTPCARGARRNKREEGC